MTKVFRWMMLAAVTSFSLVGCDMEVPTFSGLEATLDGKSSRYYNGKLPAARIINKKSSLIMAQAQAKRFDVDLALVMGVITQESGFNVTAVSRVGALGLMQLMPTTVTHINQRSPIKISSPFNPSQNIAGGTWYLKSLYNQLKGYPETERWRLALASYNGGLGRVSGAIKKVAQASGKNPKQVTWEEIRAYLPSETQHYVPAVIRHAQYYKQTLIKPSRS